MSRRDISINGTKFTINEIGNYGFGIGVHLWRNKFDENHFIIKTVHSVFNKKMYSYPHIPMVVDDIIDTVKFSCLNDLRVLDMPIKFPGNNDYRIPKELVQFEEVIAKIASFEHTINPRAKDYFAYLTIDQSNVLDGEYQRKPGCHVDGFQGARIENKKPINRSYIVFDAISPSFYTQKFETEHLNDETDNFFLSFDEQAQDKYEVQYDPYQIILMNAYTVHKANRAPKSMNRTFFRLSYDTSIFDRYGNTKNKLFDYYWNMKLRNVQKHLRHNPLPKHHPNAY